MDASYFLSVAAKSIIRKSAKLFSEEIMLEQHPNARMMIHPRLIAL